MYIKIMRQPGILAGALVIAAGIAGVLSWRTPQIDRSGLGDGRAQTASDSRTNPAARIAKATRLHPGAGASGEGARTAGSGPPADPFAEQERAERRDSGAGQFRDGLRMTADPVAQPFEIGTDDASATPAPAAGQQYARIPLRADPGVRHLTVAEVDDDVDVRAMPSSKLAEEFNRLSSAREKEEYLAELAASKRSNITRILSELFDAEKDPAIKESILSFATDAGQQGDLRLLLNDALDSSQPVDVRLAALYFASDNAPELVAKYANDANLDVREEAQSLMESQTTQK